MVIVNLMENREGLILSKSSIVNILSCSKSLILLPKQYNNQINKLIYLISGNKVFGIIKLHSPFRLNNQEIAKSEFQHQLTKEMINSWWPSKQVLFGYTFEKVRMFSKAISITYSETDCTDLLFINHFKFTDSIELISDPKKYYPKRLPTKTLLDDWRIVTSWYSTIESGKKFKHSIEEVLNLACLIVTELLNRNVKFKPENMKDHSKKLYYLVMKNLGLNLSDVDLTNENLVDEFTDIIIIKEFICVIGSYVTKKRGQVPHDFDLLIKMTEPDEYIKRAIEVRIHKMVGWSDKIHFVWGDKEGPHDSYIPLYDLALNKLLPVKVNMSDSVLSVNKTETKINLTR